VEFLNLSLLEFSALFALGAAAFTALYLLDRSRLKVRAASLRFWQAAAVPPSQQRRRRIQQPWSLLLQLLALALLLLAIAQVRWGSDRYQPRNHVLLMDTSAAAAAQSRETAGATVLSISRQKALAWLNTLPSQDRVSVVEVGALITPKTTLEDNRARIEKAIQSTTASNGGLRLSQALDFAGTLQRRAGGVSGEIVYAGPARISASDGTSIATPANLRLLVTDPAMDNVGIRKAGVRRSLDELGLWNVLVTVRNYSARTRTATVGISFGGVPVANNNAALGPNAEQTLTLTYRTKSAGMLDVRLLEKDDFPLDNQVELELPQLNEVAVRVFSPDAPSWRPLLAANPLVKATYSPLEQLRTADAANGVVILDGADAAVAPKAASLQVQTGTQELRVRSWRNDHPLAAGLRSLDFRLTNARPLQPRADEVSILDTDQGPVLLAGKNSVRLGFRPSQASLRQEVTGPLLMANILRYLAPDSYRQWESIAASPGPFEYPIGEVDSASVRVLTGDGKNLPFSIDGGVLRGFMATRGTARIIEGDREVVFSLTLPDLAERAWSLPSAAATGIPPVGTRAPESKDLWRWLAICAALVLLVEWYWYGKRHRPWLKFAAVAAIAVALFGFSLPLSETKLAVTILADSSQSLSGQDLADLREKVSAVVAARGRHQVRVMPFARATRALTAEELTAGVQTTPGELGSGTNLESAIRDAIASSPSGLVPRIVLISDGIETEGSALQGLWQARQMNVPIDVFALRGRQKPLLRLDSVRVPSQAFAGEKFPVEITLNSPRAATAKLEIRAEGKLIGAGSVALKSGANEVTATSAVSTSGVVHLSGTISAPELGDATFDQVLAVERPRMLYVSQDPEGSDLNLRKAVEANQFELTRAAELPLAELAKYEVVVLNNQDLEGYSPAAKQAIESFVKAGGGLLTIGGERNQYVEKKPGTPEDPLERTLPAKLAPPRSPEGTCVVLIVDKSSSMEGRKMELARIASIGVIENLRPIDLIGVLIFDNSHQWAVPIRRAEDKVLIKRLVAGITPDGGTQIAPALAEAYKKILPVKATFKHVVLLTDGISEEGDSINLAREAGSQRITISTVGLGQDVNKGYLEKVAQFSKGRSYFLTDPTGLEQILLRDVMEFTGSTAVEKPTQPLLVRAAEILEGTGIDKAPALKGYVKYEAKPAADLLLNVPGEKANTKDPLLVRWQYGLGRVTVFTSDAKSRWAEDWVSWNGFDKFWGNVMRDLLPHAQAQEAGVAFDRANQELEITYRLPQGPDTSVIAPPVFVFGPNGFQQPVPLQRVATGVFRGRVAIGDRTGLFRVRPAEVTRYFPEIGHYREEMERTAYGNRPGLLRQIADFSGGRLEPRAADVFAGGGRQIDSSLPLWPLILALAILLSLVEVFLRKGGLRSIRRQEPAAQLSYT
jgi:uncharacterized membrane protein